jgi:hypothetical protein
MLDILGFFDMRSVPRNLGLALPVRPKRQQKQSLLAAPFGPTGAATGQFLAAGNN